MRTTVDVDMHIPKIIHQLWKDEHIPRRWQAANNSVKTYHPGWEYRLWTDSMIDSYVQRKHRDFYPSFSGMTRDIMRADVFRYLLMRDIGGLYCDLDYEFLRPFDYGDAEVVLSMEYEKQYGDRLDQVANFIFASVPGHALWNDVLDDLRTNPPEARSQYDVCNATGPGLVSRVFFQNRDKYDGIRVVGSPVLSPRRVHGRYERKHYLNTGITYGFHHGWGSWRDRFTASYLKRKLRKWGRWLRGEQWNRA